MKAVNDIKTMTLIYIWDDPFYSILKSQESTPALASALAKAL